MDDTPLTGRRVLVARARPGQSAVAAELRAAGAEVLELPEVETIALPGPDLDAALGRDADAVVFACAAGVDAVFGAPGVRLERPILAVGDEAAAALAGRGAQPLVCIRGACREALAEEARWIADRRLLLVTSEEGRPGLLGDLAALGAWVSTAPAYRSIHRMPEAPLPPVDLVVLPSSSAARAVLRGAAAESLRRVPMVAIGERTERAAAEGGARSVTRAGEDTREALVAAARSALARPADPAARGWLLVYTGHGKGKTTAALGIVFRALGRGRRVGVVQFIKGKWKTGERLFAETIPGLTFLVMGRGFTWDSDDLARDRRAAAEAWQTSAAMLGSGSHDVVVLDEITYAIHYGFIALDDVLAALRTRPAHVHVVVTGRNAPEPLCEMADLVTEMKSIKHPFERGEKAQPGIDY